MKYKKIVKTYVISVPLLAFIFFGTLFILDPLKLFHKPWVCKEYLEGNMREQAAGIINNWKFDSIILGTSMLENTSSKEASKKLGGSFVNISLSGSSFLERKLVLEYALRKKELKKVLYSLDDLGSSTDKVDDTYVMSNWSYLYDDNKFNDIQAYLNNKYLKHIFSFRCVGEKVDFDRPNAWYKFKEHSLRFGGLDNWFKAKNNQQIKDTFSQILTTISHIKATHVVVDNNMNEKIKNIEQYLDEALIAIVEKNSKVDFIFIVPPYFRGKYAMWAQANKSHFELYKTSLKYLVLKSKQYNNMKVYAWGTEKFIDEIANYKDLSHYEYKINSWMLDAIKETKGLLVEENVDEYLNVVTQKALKYNLFMFGDKIDSYLNSKKE